MLTNDLTTIRQMLKVAVETAAREGAVVIDADEQISALGRVYPNGVPFDQEALRKEVAALAVERGMAVRMGGR